MNDMHENGSDEPEPAAAEPGGGGVSFSLQPVRVETGSTDERGCLVFRDGKLVAVLVRLSEMHDGWARRWFLEWGGGRLDGSGHPTFADLAAAQAWVSRRLGHAVKHPP